MRPQTYARQHEGPPRPPSPTPPERHRALVREVIAGAVLPRLLERKDAGAFDTARRAAPAPVTADE